MNESILIKEAQTNALDKCVIEAQHDDFNFEEVSYLHAVALLNFNKTVYGYSGGEFFELQNVQMLSMFKTYFIE